MNGCENWAIKKAKGQRIGAFGLWFRTDAFELLEKTLESSLECKDIQPVHPKRNQSWIFIQRIDVKDKTPILWPPDVKNWLIGKNPDAGKDWKQRRRGWQRMRWLDGITDSVTWAWVNSGSWWWTGRPGVLQFMGSQRVGHNWATELHWTDEIIMWFLCFRVLV